MLIDPQSAKNAAPATGATGGFDAGKLVKGRKRLVLIDTLGNVLASQVVPAGTSDAAAAIAFWDEVATTHPLLGQVQLVVGDSSFAGLFAEHLARHYGLRFEKPVQPCWKKTSASMKSAGSWNAPWPGSAPIAACRRNRTDC